MTSSQPYSTTPRFCTHCGSPYRDNAKFCTGCGQPMTTQPPTAAPAAPTVPAPPATDTTYPPCPPALPDPTPVNLPPQMASALDKLGKVGDNFAKLPGFISKNAIIVSLALIVAVAFILGLGWWGMIPLAIFLFALYAGATFIGAEPCGFESSLRTAFTSINENHTAPVENSGAAATTPMPGATIPPAPAPGAAMPQAQIMTMNPDGTYSAQPQSMQPGAPYGSPQTIIIQTAPTPAAPSSNGIGTAGFVFSLLSFLFSWTVIGGAIIWFLGLLFSFIGMFRKPRGLAIAGFVLCIPSIILIIVLFTLFGSVVNLFS